MRKPMRSSRAAEGTATEEAAENTADAMRDQADATADAKEDAAGQDRRRRARIRLLPAT
jgi:hypothetical protein